MQTIMEFLSRWLREPAFLKVIFVRYYYTVRGHNTVEQNLMPDSWLILSPVAAPACGVHKNCKITFTPDGGAINVAKRGNKSESLPLQRVDLPLKGLRDYSPK